MELYLNLQVVKQRVYRGLKLVDFGKKEVIYQNHDDMCRQKEYDINSNVICGYGTPAKRNIIDEEIK